MLESLFLTDLVLATLAVVAALVVARGGRKGRWFFVLAGVVAARLVVAGLLLVGGSVTLADSRLIIQIPLAVLPTAWATVRPSRTAVHVSAAGVLLSVWWLLVPFGPQDTAYVLAGSVAALALIGGLSVFVRSRRALWLPLSFLVLPAVVLVTAGQANASAHQHPTAGQLSVDQLVGPQDREPDVRLTLTAARGTVRLSSGHTVDALTFNGTSPGPEIRAKKGQLVEVTLVNTDVAEGVTVHWHGVDVPNAEDGVPGVTQDAVAPGARHVYRFVPTRAGTFWYHTHRDGSTNVRRGLFGALIVDEATGFERTLFTHSWPGDVLALDRADGPARQAVAAGRSVRLRLVNSSEDPQRLVVGGVPFAVAAIDGNAVEGATPLDPGTALLLAAGGRYDLTFTMPDAPVTVALTDGPALALSPDGAAEPVIPAEGKQFDPLAYGAAATDPVKGDFQRTYDLRLDDGFGFSLGRLNYVSSLINGRLYPAVPALEVTRGDRVKVRITNRSLIDHPLHLHGHRVQVLTRNGDPATGSPWWTDTLNVAPGQVFEIAFTADNPGIWMDHCHNFRHGANGMIMHLAYTGVSTPYTSGHAPE